MNETINLSQLIVKLGSVTGADSNTSRRFLREFFATVTDVLAQEGEDASLTIPGIGTFKRSTGADGQSPVTVVFQADDAILGEANKPFSVFEAVEVAQGICPDELNSEPLPEAADEIEDEEEPSDKIVEERTILNREPDTEEESEELQSHEADFEEEVSAQNENADIDIDNSGYEASSIVPSFPEDEDDVNSDYLPQPERAKSRAWVWFVVVGLVAGIAAGLWWGLTVEVTFPEDEALIEEVVTNDTTDIISQTSESAAVEENVPDANLETSESVPVAEPVSSQPAPREPVYEIVSPTNYLSSMARRHYGAQIYWVYIYEANTDILGHPDRIAPGTRVVIPPKSSFPQASSEAEARRIAERKAAEINRRFR